MTARIRIDYPVKSRSVFELQRCIAFFIPGVKDNIPLSGRYISDLLGGSFSHPVHTVLVVDRAHVTVVLGTDDPQRPSDITGFFESLSGTGIYDSPGSQYKDRNKGYDRDDHDAQNIPDGTAPVELSALNVHSLR